MAPLRPLRIGEILDVTLKLYFRNWRTLLAIVAVVAVPMQVVSTLVSLSTAPANSRVTTDALGRSQTVAADFDAAYFVGVGIVVLLSFLVGILASAVSFKAVSDAYLGERPEIGSSLRFVVRRLHSVVWVTILFYVLVALGLIGIFIGAVYLWIAFSVAIPVLLFEEIKGFRALRRSRRLVQGRWWATFGALLIGVIMAGVLSGILQGLIVAPVFGSDTSDTARIVANGFAQVLAAVVVTPFQAGLTAVIYYDLRVRKEGFDLQLLAERLGFEPPPASAVSPEPEQPPGTEAPPFWPPPPGWSPAQE